jgi:predicted transcriptional regulator
MHPNEPLPDLAELAARHYAAGDFTTKAPSYLREYEKLLAHRRDAPLRVLELGVSSGASLLIWRDYLPNATIVGLDIDPMPDVLRGKDRIIFIQASQDDVSALERAVSLAGGLFDLIIDDASHIGYLTKRSFTHLFRHALSLGGTYVIEDYGTGFMPAYPDGAAFREPSWADAEPATREFTSHQFGMAGVIKQIMDYMMQELMTGTRPWFAVERMTVLTNVALIEKSLTPGRPVRFLPQTEPVAPPPYATSAQIDEIAARLDQLADRLTSAEQAIAEAAETAGNETAERLASQAATETRTDEALMRLENRLSRLEQVVGRVLARLAPLRRIVRFLRWSSPPPDSH